MKKFDVLDYVDHFMVGVFVISVILLLVIGVGSFVIGWHFLSKVW